ncbi:MAG: hypothetical protein WBQ04_18885 [Candidatus Acidiferrales bacterium]
MHNWNDSLKGVLFGALTGIAVGLGGFILTEIPRTHAMGGVVFLLVPFAAGVAITAVSHDLGRISAAVLLATVGSLAILIAMKMETPVCAMMAFPLLFVGLLAGVGLGYALGYLFRKLTGRFGGNDATFTSIMLLAMPLLVFAGHRLEVSNPIQARRQMVISTIRIPADPSQVWAELQSFDSVSGDKPFLMYVGLPIPVRCVLEGSGRGAKRTCYFDHGYIQETVVEWSPPNMMLLSIDRTNMPGRHWLGFENARYDLRREGGETVLTRSTTIVSYLYPAWYWGALERWGVQSEHGYIFSDLARRAFPPASIH